VVVFVGKVDLLEEVLEFVFAAVDVADEDEALVVRGEVLLVHVANLDHALECWAHVVAVAHRRCIVHEVHFCLLCCAPWAKVRPPTNQEEDEDGEIRQTVAFYASRYAVCGACDCSLEFGRDQEIVVARVEAVLFV